MSKARAYCFTLNNYDETTAASIQQFCNDGNCSYLIYGKEVAPTTLTPHLQGYMRLKHPLRMSSLQAKLQTYGIKLALIVANGTAQQNIAYCSKEDPSPFVFGDPGPGQGSKLSKTIAIISNGGSLQDVAYECPEDIVKYSTGVAKLISLRSSPRTEPPVVVWCCGPTGTGKSRFAWTHFPDAFSKDITTRWWDGYSAQTCTILDDYRPSREMPFHYLLRLLDRYPVQVEIKGLYIQFNSKFVIITSPKEPREMFSQMDWIGSEALDQMDRRINYILHFPNPVLPADLALVLGAVMTSNVETSV